MIEALRRDSDYIISKAIEAVLPEEAVSKALEQFEFPQGKLLLVAIGKAAFRMAKCAVEKLEGKITAGIVITKYKHSEGKIEGVRIFEAGHPVSDGNTYLATREALKLTGNLNKEDKVLFLVSGGGSALFENPLVSEKEWEDINSQLLKCGAEISEINAVRKKLSSVKGGKFAEHVYPASIFSVVLSDVLGNDLSVIASGPAYPDKNTNILPIIEKYNLTLSKEALSYVNAPSITSLDNVISIITGSVSGLVAAAAKAATNLGYKPLILTDHLTGEAREAGKVMAEEALKAACAKENLALIEGGETTVHISGKGIGGRNQEYALAAADIIAGKNICIFSVGSDGTDGPTDAAGGYVDGQSAESLRALKIDACEVLKNNDSYNALKAVGGLIMTGPTGTNVNDVAVALIRKGGDN